MCNENFYRVENYKGTSNTVLLDEQNEVKCFYGINEFFKVPFGYIETEYGYITYQLLEI